MGKAVFPALEAKIAEQKITKKSIAHGLGIDVMTFSRKLTGKTEFTLKEIKYIHELFPELPVENLFGIKRDLSQAEIKPVTLKLDDAQITESLKKIEERIDRIMEKANRLKSTLEECEKSAE